MISILDTLKSNSFKFVLGSAGSIIAIVVALFTVDERYAHADVVEKNKSEIQNVIKDTAVILRKQSLEDKLFEYDLKRAQSPSRSLTPIDSAMQDRYRRQLDDLRSGKVLN